MAIYGQLTIERPSRGTISGDRSLTVINDMYDYHLHWIVISLPDGWDTTYLDKLTNSDRRIVDYLTLVDTDGLSFGVRSSDDTYKAALYMVRRYLNKMKINDELVVNMQAVIGGPDIEILTESIPNLNFEIQYSAIGSLIDITDTRNYFDEALTDNNVIQEQQDFMQYLDPRFIFENAQYNIQDKYGTYLPKDIQNGYLMKGFATTSFSESQSQNIYTNYFGEEQSFYNVGEINSKSLEKVSGFIQSSSMIEGTGGMNSSLMNNTSKISNAVNLMNNPNLFGFNQSPPQVNPLSNNGSQTQQVFTEEEMNQTEPNRKTAYSKKLNTPTVAKFGNNKSSKVIVQRVLPLQYDTGLVGNKLTADSDAQFQATVARIIDRNGVAKNLSYDINEIKNIKTENTSINGTFKFRNNSRSSSVSKKLSKFSFSAGITNPLSAPATTSLVYNTSVDLLTNPRQGQLGVETFDDSGYDGWYLGERTPIFLVNLDNDIGYNSFDKGTAYSSGNIETFDIGWTEGVSPYSRKGESSIYSDDITSQIDGLKTSFVTTYPYIRGTLQVSYNGVDQVIGTTFTETSATSFTLSFTPLSGDFLTATYQRFFDTSPSQDNYADNRAELKAREKAQRTNTNLSASTILRY
jgi:hypothetical protein